MLKNKNEQHSRQITEKCSDSLHSMSSDAVDMYHIFASYFRILHNFIFPYIIILFVI